MFEYDEQSNQILECEEDIKMAKTSFTKYDKEYKSMINKKNMIDTTTEHIKKEIEEKVMYYIVSRINYIHTYIHT